MTLLTAFAGTNGWDQHFFLWSLVEVEWLLSKSFLSCWVYLSGPLTTDSRLRWVLYFLAFTSLPFRVFLCSFYTQLPGVLVVLNRRTRKKYICSIFPEAGWKILFKYSQIWFTLLLAMHNGCIFSMSIPTLVFCFIKTILISVKWYLIVICACISSWLLILSISPSAY